MDGFEDVVLSNEEIQAEVEEVNALLQTALDTVFNRQYTEEDRRGPDVNVRFSFDDVANSDNSYEDSEAPSPRGPKEPVYFDSRERSYSSISPKEESRPKNQMSSFPFWLLTRSSDNSSTFVPGDSQAISTFEDDVMRVPVTEEEAIYMFLQQQDIKRKKHYESQGVSESVTSSPSIPSFLPQKTTSNPVSTTSHLTPEDYLRICFHNATGCDFSLNQPDPDVEEAVDHEGSSYVTLEPVHPSSTIATPTLKQKTSLQSQSAIDSRERLEARVRACFFEGQCTR